MWPALRTTFHEFPLSLSGPLSLARSPRVLPENDWKENLKVTIAASSRDAFMTDSSFSNITDSSGFMHAIDGACESWSVTSASDFTRGDWEWFLGEQVAVV